MNVTASQQTRKRILIGAVLWLCCLQFFACEWFTAARYYPIYAYSYQLISDLGVVNCSLNIKPVICSQRHLFMNLSFMLLGGLMAGGAVLIRRSFNERIGFNFATAAMLAAGVGVFWMGAAPADVATQLHSIFLNIYMLCGSLAVLLYGVMLFFVPGEMPILGLVSVLTGIPMFTAGLLIATGGTQTLERQGLPQGVIQRIDVYGVLLWQAAVAIVLLVRKGREAPPMPPIYLPPPPPPRMK